ncbi:MULTISPECIES: methyltransferase domain-containing protein [unclassified Streptomyces]|uniref:methyltransferase domain-containing protein n=1 Tax=unclassified Streptomyces TaxID=2593676 RepID=UPI00380B1722
MTATIEQRPSRTTLGRSLAASGALASDWAPTFAAVDRAAFLPSLMWPYDMDTRTSVPVGKADDPGRWYACADQDIPIVTQWDDGNHEGREPGKVSTSSSSMPSVVYRLLQDLDIGDGMTVLDVGTGTGETAGALTHRLTDRHTVTIDVDAAVARSARTALHHAGFHPTAVAGDGFEGYAPRAPYDRILATCGLRHIPGAWIDQTRPGGLIVAPWGTHYSNADAVARLVVKDGAAEGKFAHPVEFMKLRSQRFSFAGHDSYVPRDMSGADTSTTDVTEEEFVTGQYTALPFAIGLRVPRCRHSVADKRDGARPAWFYELGDTSWACAMFRDGAPAKVWQHGERRLWDEVEAAFRWWQKQGRPAHDRFGLTITPDGHTAWLDEPGNALTATL